MSGINRFLSRREKRSSGVHNEKVNDKPQNVSHTNLNLFSPHDRKKPEKEEAKKVQAIMQQLTSAGITTLKEPQVEYALRSKAAQGDSKKALDLLYILEDSVEGLIRPCKPNVKLLGAENRQGNTCYLDATLFAMYAGLDSFEAMLYDNFSDEPRRNLALLLRLWVNLLRAGKLITTDLTERLQETIATCGWADAAKLRQQDASEAFTFITGKLELPLLTLKVDIYHTGKEEAAEDHKFVNERLLDVAIPPPPEDGSVIRLEDCLETYFNNRIEVKRHLHRRSTIQSIRSIDSGKGLAVHVETVEISSRPESPASLSPSITTSQLRPTSPRHRAPSLFSERKLQLENSSESRSEDGKSDAVRHRTSSITRKEVLMPAWQFFSLLPWYTNNAPTSDDQVAAHFASKRPVLGICLKRYGFTADGKAVRLDTYIDIPLEIALPDFISDDELEGRGPAFGSFKLSLQSVVCHRGTSLNSGHYITLARLHAPDTELATQACSRPGTTSSQLHANRWVRFDDLASERVSPVDIAQALKNESPYLLFYQVRPIDDDEEPLDEPPPYVERTPTSERSEHESLRASMETDTARPSTEANGWTRLDHVANVAPNIEDNQTTMYLPDVRRSSIAFTETSETSLSGSLRSDQIPSEPSTPLEEGKHVFSIPSRRNSKSGKKGEKGGASSSTGTQHSLTIAMLSKLGVSRDTSKEKLGAADNISEPQQKSSARQSLDLFRSGRHDDAPTKEKNILRSTSLMGRRYRKSSNRMKAPDRECLVM